MSKLVNRTTDDRLDDLLEAVEKQTSATNRASMQAAETSDELKKRAKKIEMYASRIYGCVLLVTLAVGLLLAGSFFGAVLNRIGQVAPR